MVMILRSVCMHRIPDAIFQYFSSNPMDIERLLLSILLCVFSGCYYFWCLSQEVSNQNAQQVLQALWRMRWERRPCPSLPPWQQLWDFLEVTYHLNHDLDAAPSDTPGMAHRSRVVSILYYRYYSPPKLFSTGKRFELSSDDVCKFHQNAQRFLYHVYFEKSKDDDAGSSLYNSIPKA